MATHKGTAWEDEVLSADTIIMPEETGEDGMGFEVASMRKVHSCVLWLNPLMSDNNNATFSLQHHTHRGWVYLDLVKPNGQAIHLQIYLHLSRKGIKHQTSLGRLDLDSNADSPQPSGVVGKVEFSKTGDYVTYIITPDVANIENTVNDSTKKPSKLLFGKGVETTTYVHHPGCRLNLFIGREARYHEHTYTISTAPSSAFGEMRHTKHEVEGATSKFVGICSQFMGREVFKAHLKIHPVTGIVETGKGYLANTLQTKTIFSTPSNGEAKHAHALCYGFSDQGAGRSDQVYAYLSKVHEGWLCELIEEEERWLDVEFSKLALAGAHDAGMFEALNPGLLFVIENGTLAKGLAKSPILDLGTPVVRTLIRALESISFRPDRALQNLANTQKDDTATLLRLGVRFFDFRPGYNFYDAVHAQKKEIRHQHAIVPGEDYIAFLSSILHFLARNPKEIVMVELKMDGMILPEDKFDKAGNKVAVSMAYEATGKREIKLAQAVDLDSKIGNLIDKNKRLFVIDRVHNPHDWYRSDSYDHIAYGTDNPATIMAQLAKTHEASSQPDGPHSGPKRGCIYQLQATPTSRMVDAAKSALTFSDASSLLVWMKPQQDRVTYPWIVRTEFNDPGNVIFLNDFCDGALVDHTIDVCRRRTGLVRQE